MLESKNIYEVISTILRILNIQTPNDLHLFFIKTL